MAQPNRIKRESVKFDAGKFRELLLYIAERCEKDDKFGAVKLNKILYFADFEAHRRLGRSITGAEYQRLPEGPAPRQLVPVRESLINEDHAAVESKHYFRGVQQRLVAKRHPDVTKFTPKELEIVDEVIAALWHMNGKETTGLSHDEPGWRLVEEGETIPYRTAWLSPELLTQEQIEAGKRIAKRHGLAG